MMTLMVAVVWLMQGWNNTWRTVRIMRVIVCLRACLPAFLSFILSVFLCVCVCVSVCVCVCVNCLFVCLSVCLSVGSVCLSVGSGCPAVCVRRCGCVCMYVYIYARVGFLSCLVACVLAWLLAHLFCFVRDVGCKSQTLNLKPEYTPQPPPTSDTIRFVHNIAWSQKHHLECCYYYYHRHDQI